jgi:hypothetical protein
MRLVQVTPEGRARCLSVLPELHRAERWWLPGLPPAEQHELLRLLALLQSRISQGRPPTAEAEVREETSLTVTAEHLTGVYYERKCPGFEVWHFAFRCRLENSAVTRIELIGWLPSLSIEGGPPPEQLTGPDDAPFP